MYKAELFAFERQAARTGHLHGTIEAPIRASDELTLPGTMIDATRCGLGTGNHGPAGH